MIQVNKGHIVTVASMASFVALAKGADYSATKLPRCHFTSPSLANSSTSTRPIAC